MKRTVPMKPTRDCDRSCRPNGWLVGPERWSRIAAVLLTLSALAGTARAKAQQAPQSAPQKTTGNAQEAGSGQAANPLPAVDQSTQNGASDHEVGTTDRRKQIADESAILLKLATDLKAEVDKTTKDTLSLNVIRKADQIEKLAHNVKEQMAPAAGQN